YEDAVGQGQDFVQFGGHEQNASAFVAGAHNACVNGLNGANAHPARGLGRDQQPRLPLEFARRDELTRAALSTCGRAKSKFLSVRILSYDFLHATNPSARI
ncbi:MAG: hypothetical protein KA117_08240, partial [Verrucomicrobia bacterium]|nr:hypothetical protein [Verrucomicrobiota bacterium]